MRAPAIAGALIALRMPTNASRDRLCLGAAGWEHSGRGPGIEVERPHGPTFPDTGTAPPVIPIT